jgi:hypothetical protein
MSKLSEKPSALEREHPALEIINFLNFSPYCGTIFALLDPDPVYQNYYGSGSAALVEC